jgi:hypothetical protein
MTARQWSKCFHLRQPGAVACIVLLLAVSITCNAQPVAMITDLTGKVTAPGVRGGVTILAEIEADTRVVLESGARLVAIHLTSGDEYSVAGPAQVQFGSEGMRGLSGAKPVKRASPLAGGGQDIRIRPGAVTQAAFVMRSGSTANRITLLTLTGTKTLDRNPDFQWQAPAPGLTYRFELTDDSGRTLVDAEVEGTTFRLSSVQLKEGASYTWEVSPQPQQGRRVLGVGGFSVASADLIMRAKALRPPAGAPVSARVTYAAWLAQAELRDEAHRHWSVLARERPQDARLRALAQR